jgi:Ca2+-dependent lipid-binding protein
MDPDGKADPYVEVSLRPGHKKYTTAIKTNSLNPTFNETAEFPVKLKDLEGELLYEKIVSLFCKL